jgi:hypothetical protein
MTYYDGELDVQRRKDETRALADRYLREKMPDEPREPHLVTSLVAKLVGLFRRQGRSKQPMSSDEVLGPAMSQDVN